MLAALSCSESKSPVASENDDPLSLTSQNNQASPQKSTLTSAEILLFTKTAGWRHDSIEAGIAFFERLSQDQGMTLTATEDAEVFTDQQLRRFDTIMFMNTTGDVLNDDQQLAMERYIQAGGGFLGIHAAADTETDGKNGDGWFWYHNLVGGLFNGHPNDPAGVQEARLNKTDVSGPLNFLPDTFEFADEWYDYRDLYAHRTDLLTLDDSSYTGSQHKEYHPITWFHEYDGGRAFYTGLGHPKAVYKNERFKDIVLAGLRYTVGEKKAPAVENIRPLANRFSKEIIAESFNEPMKFDFLSATQAIVTERPGHFIKVDLHSGEKTTLGTIPDIDFMSKIEMGLQGVAVDPNFASNQRIFYFYSARKQGRLVSRIAHAPVIADAIDFSQQKIVIDIPVDETCCHVGGDLEFEPGTNNLFISVGDNTSAFESDGYAPIDFSEGQHDNDALRSSANTNDLRGKILRVTPKLEGGYSIPEGNLFEDDNSELTRDEIYVMGTRNPYTISFDARTQSLFFGDIGPDAKVASAERGANSYDEINRAQAPGNFGWPLLIGDNEPYRDYDFIAKKSAKLFDPLNPINKSPRNTGLKNLPPAERALVWYNYKTSQVFPELGSGGRSAMVAGMYHAEDYAQQQSDFAAYPSYYDNKLFIFELMRGWFKVLSFDEYGRIIKVEPFINSEEFKLANDAKFGPDGNLYVLEYGPAWFSENESSKLSAIRFNNEDNRSPSAVITADATQGAAPLTLRFSASQSADPDGDTLSYSWNILGGTARSKTSEDIFDHTFAEAGNYTVELEVSDAFGNSSADSVVVEVGNAVPQIDIVYDVNQSFYWPGEKARAYRVSVQDREDGAVNDHPELRSKVIVRQFDAQALAEYQGASRKPQATEGHQSTLESEQEASENVGFDEALFAVNACSACHLPNKYSAGPSWKMIAKRYASPEGEEGMNMAAARDYLVERLALGGQGKWGDKAMPSYAHLDEATRIKLADNVLKFTPANRLAPKADTDTLTTQGNITLSATNKVNTLKEGVPGFVVGSPQALLVTYTDQGTADARPIRQEKIAQLIPAQLQIGAMVQGKKTPSGFMADWTKGGPVLTATGEDSQSYAFALGQFDLSAVTSFQFGIWQTVGPGKWQIEVRDLIGDTVLAESVFELEQKDFESGNETAFQFFSLPLNAPINTKTDLTMTVKKLSSNESRLHIDRVNFLR